MNVRPLEKSQRRMMMIWSASLCLASVLLAPLAARSSGDVHAQEELEIRAFETPAVSDSAPARVVVSRDPFSADMMAPEAPDVHPDVPPVPVPNGLVGSQVQAGTPIGIALPPNRGADGMLSPTAFTGSAITAIITGDHPQALVTEGDRSRILSVGDRLEGHKVRSIAAGGVYLDDGSVRLLIEGRP